MSEATQADGKAPKVGRVESVSVRLAENGGAVVSVSRRPAPATSRSLGPAYEAPKDYAFGSVAEAVGFIEEQLGVAQAQAS